MQELQPDMADTTAIKLSAVILWEFHVYLCLYCQMLMRFLKLVKLRHVNMQTKHVLRHKNEVGIKIHSILTEYLK